MVTLSDGAILGWLLFVGAVPQITVWDLVCSSSCENLSVNVIHQVLVVDKLVTPVILCLDILQQHSI